MLRTGRSSRVFGSFFAALLFGLLITQGLYAQVDTGTILGTVKDQTGAIMPGAKVTLTNEGTNFTVATTTGADGSYLFTPVKIGAYSVSAEATGFAKAVESHLTLNINQSLVADLTLKPGAVTQTVEVTASAPLMQTQDSSVGQVINSQSVNNLPLNGRNFTFLAQIVAGVNTPQADTRGNAASGAFSANGLRPAQNNYLLNGIDNNSDTVDFLNGTNFVVLPPIDAIQEFKVQTSDYSAQYGRSGAAILNATIKSGTNQIHGNVWEFFRNDKLDSANFFEDAGGLHKGEYRQNQFGFTIGGPVIIPHVYDGKNKLFFFGDLEILRRRQGSIFSSLSVPTALERTSGYTNFADLITGQAGSATEKDALGRVFPAGTVLDPATTRAVTAGTADPVTGLTPAANGFVRDPFFTGPTIVGVTDFTGFCASNATCMLNQIPGGRIDQNAVKFLNLYPAPIRSSLFSNFSSNPVLSENREAFDTRLDFNKSDTNQLFGTFSYVTDPQYIPSPFGGIADGGAFQQGNQAAITILGALSYTHIFSPTTVNEARLGENRIHTSRYGPVATQFGLPSQYGISTATIPQCCHNGGLPAIGFSGLNTIGSNNFLPSDEISQTTQLTDNLTKIYGKHSFKSGVEYQHVKYSTFQPAYSHGQFNYNGTYTGIVNGPGGNTGPAQFVLLPCPGPTAGGTPTGCPSVPGAIPDVGGMNGYLASNLGFTDDGKNYWGAYFQDDWKYNSKLTLNLGVRWDLFGQTYEHYGAQANIVPGAPCHPASTAAGCAQFLIPTNRNNGLSASFLALTALDGIDIVPTNNKYLGNSQLGNFGPRLGLAYQISNKLVMRTGAGIFFGGFENRGYGPNIGENYPFQFNFSFNAPNGQTPISSATFANFVGTPCANALMFETGFDCTPIQTSLVNAEGLGLEGLQFNYQTPYTMGWNLTFQYQLTPSLTLSMGYVGNGARHLRWVRAPTGSRSSCRQGTNLRAQTAPNSGVGLYINYPDFSQGFSYRTSNGDSYYHSLQTTLEQRYGNGLNFLLAYTYSRCRSDAGDSLNGGSVGGRSVAYVPGVGIQYDYTDCSYDVRNVVHFSGGYELPFGNGKKFFAGARGAANQIVGGWSTQWSATMQGGQPLNLGCDTGTSSGLGCNDFIIPGVNRHGSGGVNQFLNPAAFTQPCLPGKTTPTRCIPGITGIGLLGGAEGQTSGPGLDTFDFSVFKNFQLSERARLQFRTEIFNVLNHPTFNSPGFGGNGVVSIPGSTDYLSSNFGKIGSTRFVFNDPRQIQIALKLYW